MRCTDCGKWQQGDRAVRGWKRIGDAVLCSKCFGARYVLRAITLPVTMPVGVTWDQFGAALRDAWRDTTNVANWAVVELLKADVVRTPDMAKCPPMPKPPYLYPGARKVAPHLTPTSVTCVLRAVERRYRADRYEALWLRKKAVPVYRYPMPYPVHNQAWSVAVGDDGGLLLSVPVGGERYHLRLRGSPQFARQRAAVMQLIAGDALPGEAALYQRRDKTLMAKLAMWLPKAAPPERSGTLYVYTGDTSLIVYHVGSEPPVHYHADHARRWAAEHAKRLQRTAADAKEERRHDKKHRRRTNAKRRDWAAKHRARMDSLTHEVSAMIAGYADRRGVARVEYNDEAQGYVTTFPWHELKTKLQYKLEALGIECVMTSADVDADDAAALEREGRITICATTTRSVSKGGSPCAPHRSQKAP